MRMLFWTLTLLGALWFAPAAHAQQTGCTPNSLTIGCYVYPQAIEAVPQTLPDGSVTAPSIAWANSTNSGLYHNSSTNSWGLVSNGTEAMTVGNAGDTHYPAHGLILQDNILAIRSGTMGCEDQGVALSVMSDGIVAANGNGLSLHAGINGNCQNGLAALADYGSFDSVTEYRSQGSTVPPFLRTPVTYDANHVYFSTPLNAGELALLNPYQYVLTNSVDAAGRPYGSYVLSWAPDGTSITVVGWTSLGSGNTTPNQVPSSNYLSGTPTSPTVYVGQPTSLFTSNEVCSLPSGRPMITFVNCSEFDVVNNSGADIPLTDLQHISGVSLLSLGGNRPGTGLYIAGQSGSSNAFQEDIALANFGDYGIYIGQTPSSGGGVALEIAGLEQSSAIPINVQQQSGADVFTVFSNGFTSLFGGLKITGSSSSSGNYLIAAQPTVSGSVRNSFLVDNLGDTQIGGALAVAGGISATGANAGGYVLTLQPTVGGSVVNAMLVDLNGNETIVGGMEAQSFQINSLITQPGCSSVNRGTLWVIRGTTTADQIQVCRFNGSTYAWATISAS